ncbi:MAG: HPr(Ser) kinase/phosphatase [Clostridia bacterium]|nr:HPr(Ser) kinase/phosphatase [Clostridia bacterium]
MGKIKLTDAVEKLGLEVINMSSKTEVEVTNSNFHRPGLQLAGYFEHYADKRVQIIGLMEMSYIMSLSEDERQRRIEDYFAHGMPMLIITRALDYPECIKDIGQRYDVPIFRSQMQTSELIHHLVTFIDDAVLPTTTLHAVMLDIYGQGVVIMGQSGVGKSETALELLQRGSKLVADDAVVVQRRRGNRLVGQAPELIKYFMEIRGIGIIDVKAMFGVGSVVEKKDVDMVVKLENWDPTKSYERLGMKQEFFEILGVKVPCVTIPVRPGRNMASVLEVAARNERLKSMGYHAAEELNKRVIEANTAKK